MMAGSMFEVAHTAIKRDSSSDSAVPSLANSKSMSPLTTRSLTPSRSRSASISASWRTKNPSSSSATRTSNSANVSKSTELYSHRKSNAGRQERTLIAGLNFKMSADLPKTLPHSANSESPAPRTSRHGRIGACGHSSAKIFDLQDHLICLPVQTNDGVEAPGMAENI